MSKPIKTNNPKPHFLLLGSQMETGGAQHNLLSQALWLHQHDYRVTVAFLYDKEGLGQSWQSAYPFPIIDLKAKRWQAGKIQNTLLFIRGLWGAYRLMGQYHFDAIETFTHHANLAGIPLAWLSGIPLRIANHRGRFKNFPAWQEKLHAMMINSRMTDTLVVNSRRLYTLAIEEGVHAEKIVIIPNGVSLPETDERAREQVFRELNLDQNCRLVLSAGRLRYEKGHTFLLKAIPAVLARHPNTHFALAGDGTLRQELEEETEALGIQESVLFLGRREDTPRLMNAADLFVLPSRSEGMPNALMEAMGMGTACISTEVGGAEEIIQNGLNGLLVPPENVPALAHAIDTLLQDNELRQKIAAAGKTRISEDYTRESMCLKFCALLDGNKNR